MIDILLSTYNGEAFLKEQLDSILNQTYKDFKLIIRDDGSSDSTVDIIMDYVRTYPSEIIYINNGDAGRNNGGNENEKWHLGFNLSYNELLKYSTSGYIMFSDQDDVWLPKKIEISIERIKELEKRFPDKPILVHSDLTVVNKDLETINSSFFKHIRINPSKNSLNRLIMQNTVTGCATIINKNLVNLAMPLGEEVFFYDYWFALVARLFGVIDVINEPLILYRQHGSNVIGAGADNMRKLLKKIGIIKDLYRQGCLLYKRYYNYNGYNDNDKGLKSNDKMILKSFIEIGSANIIKKTYIIFKYKFLRQGFKRNIGITIGLILFKVDFIKIKTKCS